MTKYKYLLFDADGTLFDFDYSEEVSLKKTFEHFSLPFTDEIYRDYHEINDSYWKKFELKLVTKEELLVFRYRDLVNKYNLNAFPEQMNEYYLTTLSRCCYLFEDSQSVLETIKERGYHLYLVTNGETRVQKNRYVISPISHLFDDVFISGQVGVAKPDRGFFDYVFEHIEGINQDNCAIIGDSLSSDIKGGNNAGIDTVWFNPKEKQNNSGVICTYTVKSLKELTDIFG